MKIVTWNINGIKARLHILPAWLRSTAPDVVVLQETKSVDANFPAEPIEDAGYNVAIHGQKSFNGVAILSKHPLEDVVCGLPGDDADEQARWIEATIIGQANALRVCGLYLPNGNPIEDAAGNWHEKFTYKLGWMERMHMRAQELMALEEPALMAGDYNIIPQDIDAARPEAYASDALAQPESRAAYRRIVNQGWTEVWRSLNPGVEAYSFWDYQAGAWRKNDGVRIDHILLNPPAADLVQGCGVEREMRAGEKPSDHVPVWCELKL